jgi:transposase
LQLVKEPFARLEPQLGITEIIPYPYFILGICPNSVYCDNDPKCQDARRAIIRAMVAAERNPRKLAELRDPRIQASREEVTWSLKGNWRPELLFVLQQEVEMYDTYQQRIAECDQQLQKYLASFVGTVPSLSSQEEAEKKKTKPAKNAPRFELGRELQRITGVDLTRIDGIDVMVAQTLVSEVGLNMSRWKTEAHFSSWLGLCPDNRTSGDKVLGRGTRRVVSRAATALRMCGGHFDAQPYLPWSAVPPFAH